MNSRSLILTTLLLSLAFSAACEDAELLLRGLPRIEALAVNPQGALFIATGDKIVRIPGPNELRTLASTGGRPVALAFDAAGDAWVTDDQGKLALRITPWGEVVPALDREAPRAGAATAGGRFVFVADDAGAIWRTAVDGESRTRFASLDAGRVSGMALDEKGNLYVAAQGAGKVLAFSPEGKLIGTYSIPGPQVTAIAFGGLDLRTLLVAEASTGAIYKIRVPHRSQRLPWESDQPLRITDPPDGAILNRHDGETTAEGLRIKVKGESHAGGPVRINGTSVEAPGGKFEAAVLLSERENRIVAEGPNGSRETVTYLWDRDSFPRYRVSTDDNIWFLRDIARNAGRYGSIFDNPYLGFWREMHRKYGAKVHFNLYYETEGFNLSQMPDKYRPEWQANRDWIRLTFHARANDPDRPYIHASAGEIQRDYRLVTREIERFAGKELTSLVTTVHWGETTRAAARALRAEGVTGMVGYFDARDEFPSVCYYLPLSQWLYMKGRDYWKDTSEDILFVRHDIVINTVPLDKIVPHLERIAADPHQAEIMELMIHEQYFYPNYRDYEPDYRERVERAIEWVTKRGYRPVFYSDGFLGAARSR